MQRTIRNGHIGSSAHCDKQIVFFYRQIKKAKPSEDGHTGERTHHMWVCASSVPSPAAGLFQWTDRPTGSDREGGLCGLPTDVRPLPTESYRLGAAGGGHDDDESVCCLCVRTRHDCPSSSRVCLPRDESRTSHCLQREMSD